MTGEYLMKSQKGDLMVMMKRDSKGEEFLVLGHPEDIGRQVWLDVEEFMWMNEQIQEFLQFRERVKKQRREEYE